jgi:hypothetical protein
VHASAAGVAVQVAPGVTAFVPRADLPPSARAHPQRIVGTEVEGLVVEAAGGWGVTVSPRRLGAQRCDAAAGTRRKVAARVVRASGRGLELEIAGLEALLPWSELRSGARPGELRRCYVIRATAARAILSDYPPRARRP